MKDTFNPVSEGIELPISDTVTAAPELIRNEFFM